MLRAAAAALAITLIWLGVRRHPRALHEKMLGLNSVFPFNHTLCFQTPGSSINYNPWFYLGDQLNQNPAQIQFNLLR